MATFLACWASGEVALRDFALVQHNISPIWPPAGIALATVLVGGYSFLVPVALAAFLVTHHAGVPLAFIPLIASANVAEAAAAVWFLRKIRFSLDCNSFTHALAFIGVAVATPAMASALGTTTLSRLGMLGSAGFLQALATWSAGGTTGMLLCAFPVIGVLRWRQEPRRRLETVELSVAVVLIGIVTQLGFELSSRHPGYPFHHIVLPFIACAAIRFRPSRSMWPMLAMALIAIWHAAQDGLAWQSRNLLLVHVDGYIGSVAICVLLVSAAVQQHRLAIEKEQESARRLAASEERFRTVFRGARLGIALADVDGTIIKVNPAFAQMLGYEFEVLAGKHYRELVHPASCNQAIAKHREMLDGHISGYEVETQFLRKDGSMVWVQATISLTSKSEDHARHIVALVEDISERLLSKQALQRRESEFRAIFEASVDAILIFDDEGNYIEANSAAAHMLGVSQMLLPGHQIGNFSTVDRDDLLRKLTSDRVVTGEGLLQSKDGQRRRVEWYARTSSLPNRNVAVLRDVTEKENLQQQLLQSQKMEAIGRLAGGVAHDFNNLLMIMLSYSELLENTLEAGSNSAKSLSKIVEACNRAAALTKQLLSYSRKQDWDPKTINVTAALTEGLPMLERLVGPDIRVNVHAQTDRANIRIDNNQLHQLLMNLAANARDAMPDGGTLTLRTSLVGKGAEEESLPFVLLEVQDTGCGIAEEDLPHIFEPFFTTKEVGRGTGLGLSTVYAIVEKAGGAVHVSSAPGHGTRFLLQFPSVPECSSRGEDEVLPAAAGRARGTILLVDDEHDLCEATAQYLEGLGYKVLQCSSSEEGISVARQAGSEISVIVTDIVMPGGDGVTMAKQIRESLPRIPVIFISGYSEHCRKASIQNEEHFLQKPFPLSALNTLVKNVVTPEHGLPEYM